MPLSDEVLDSEDRGWDDIGICRYIRQCTSVQTSIRPDEREVPRLKDTHTVVAQRSGGATLFLPFESLMHHDACPNGSAISRKFATLRT